jgi:hypothetical protein
LNSFNPRALLLGGRQPASETAMISSRRPTSPLQQLCNRQESATIVRLGRSRHVADLRMIFWTTVIMMAIAIAVVAVISFLEAPQIWDADTVVKAIGSASPFVAAVVATGFGVLTWTYQSGSARLGAVDLFACEITTLCRVAIVVEMVQRYVDLFQSGLPSDAHSAKDGRVSTSFTSHESYFPVFDSTVKDLQSLEADVVQHVTAFYTYMKVMRDTLRKLAALAPAGAGVDDEWHRTISSVIYMQFLALESARHAIRDLVEYEPTQAEDMITILLSELVAYDFLRNRFQDALRQGQLRAREPEYRSTFQALRHDVTRAKAPQWARAQSLFIELKMRYQRIFPDAVLARDASVVDQRLSA